MLTLKYIFSPIKVNIPLDGLRQDGKRFAQFIKECQLRKDYNGMLIVFPVVAQLKDHQPQDC